MNFFRVSLPVLVVVLALSSCSTMVGDRLSDWEGGLDEYIDQDIEWQWCHTTEEVQSQFSDDLEISELQIAEAEESAQWRSSLECASIKVPLDYDDPTGESLSLKLVRRQAGGDGAEGHDGVIVAHPGGPGISGSALLDNPLFGDQVRERFDIVGFDTRGVSDEARVDCAAEPPAVSDEGENKRGITEDLGSSSKIIAEECLDRYGEDFLARMGSADSARDLDIIRIALGETQISFVGYSYSAYLGASYAEQFPGRLRALVLDSPVSLSGSALDLSRGQAEALGEAWDAFAAECGDGCPAVSGPDYLRHLIAEVEAKGLVVGEEKGDGLALLSWVAGMLYHDPGNLAEFLSAMDQGRYDEAQEWLRGYELEPIQEYRGVTLATLCVDRRASEVEDHIRVEEELQEHTPFSRIAERGMACAYWGTGDQGLNPLEPDTAPPTLVVGTPNDPAVPYSWVLEATETIPNAFLLAHDGRGHGMLGTGSDPCIDQEADNFLTRLELSEEDFSCST